MKRSPVSESKVKVYDLTVRDAAARAGVSTETVRRWARGKTIDCRRNDLGNWMFNGEDIDAHQYRHIVTEVIG
jgi:predicted site-specific integrase-resolvase